MAGFIKFPCDIYFSEKITPSEKYIYGYLLNEQNITGKPTEKSIREISKKLRMSRSTVSDALKKLEEIGLIEVQVGQMSGHTSKYFVRPV